MLEKPKILQRKLLARTRIFSVEQLSIRFSNGEKRTYERLIAGKNGAVMIVPITKDNQFILIREYSAGTDDYQLAFPKGLMEEGETIFESANRELKEEIGFGANKYYQLKSISLAPGYFTHRMNVVLAEDLYEQKLPGDEPEPLEVIYWPIANFQALLEQSDFTEARSIAALFLAKQHLASG